MSEGKIVKIGLVGLGHLGKIHLKNLLELRGTKSWLNSAKNFLNII